MAWATGGTGEAALQAVETAHLDASCKRKMEERDI